MDTNQIQSSEHVILFGKKVPIEIYDFFKTAGIVLIICSFIYLFIATPNQVEGESMKPSLYNHELIITEKFDQIFSRSYKRGDIIVFQKPGLKDFVKRVIGLPGEKVSIHSGRIFINDQELTEDYLNGVYTISGDFISNDGADIIIPENRYFVLGDNRDDSLDSRYNQIGLINKDWIKGKVILRYWPISRIALF